MLLGVQAQAQETFPNRPITMIVPFAAGGTSDVIARIVADQMGQNLGQRITHENVPGAGGSAALSRTARATADGYTIAIGNSGTNAAGYSIYDNLTYTPADFVPIGLVAKTSPMIAIKKESTANTMAEFVDYIRKNPGKVTLGHAGTGSSNYLICLNFMQAVGGEAQLIGYRGAAPALNDVLAGQIDGVCDAATSLQSHVTAGSVKAMAVATTSRIASLPNVPTSAEAGLPAFSLQGWNALFAPKGTPQAVVDRLNAALRAALKSEIVQKRFNELATIAPAEAELTPAHLGQLVPAEVEKYKQLLKK
ncbi:MAG: tripartite tricarboxylate transporter substrate-binding protein [Beijerinckiaceae bacterium]